MAWQEQISSGTTPTAEQEPDAFEDALRSEVGIRATEPSSARYVPSQPKNN
jgi:hypothetical protein